MVAGRIGMNIFAGNAGKQRLYVYPAVVSAGMDIESQNREKIARQTAYYRKNICLVANHQMQK